MDHRFVLVKALDKEDFIPFHIPSSEKSDKEKTKLCDTLQ